MRKILTVILALGLLLGACAEEDDPNAAGGGGGGGSACDVDNPPLFKDGQLTVGTDRPAYPPWFEGSPKNYSGYEGEVASEIAERMNLDIEWVVEPFNKSYAPGSKDYDFAIIQISVTPEREEVVDFSDSYFNNQQGVLVMKDNKFADATSLEDLRDAQLGAQVGTTSLQVISDMIQPESDPKVFDTTNDSKSALESGQIDALVTDLVTTVYLRDIEIKGSEVIGQIETNEPFGMLFEQGNPMVECVNQVLAEMKDDGTLDKLQKEWLKDYLSVPVLET
jgi:polar amino acid transport system substrate-binding protein